MGIVVRAVATGEADGPVVWYGALEEFYSFDSVSRSVSSHKLAAPVDGFDYIMEISWTVNSSGFSDGVGAVFSYEPTVFTYELSVYWGSEATESDADAFGPDWFSSIDYLLSQSYTAYGSDEGDTFLFYSYLSSFATSNSGGTAYGGNGNDSFYSGLGPDVFFGQAGNDIFIPAEGWWGGSVDGLGFGDLYDGGAGNDFFAGELGMTMRGGTGVDSLFMSFAGTNSPISVRLADSVGADLLLSNGTYIRDIEHLEVTFSDGNDRIDLSGFSVASYYDYLSVRTAHSNFLNGGQGTDTLVLDGQTRGEVVADSFENVVLDASGIIGGLQVYWNPGFYSDILVSSDDFSVSGEDFTSLTLSGNNANDQFHLGSALTIYGRQGNDMFFDGYGSHMDGGEGRDHLDFNAAQGTVRLARQVSQWIEIAPETYIRSFENFWLTFVGTENTLDLAGFGLTSSISQGVEDHIQDSNFLATSGRLDTLLIDGASSGIATFRDFDAVSGDLSSVSTRVSITPNAIIFGGFHATLWDWLNTVETRLFNIIGGSAADSMTGGTGNDIFAGGGGDDSLLGGSGVDRLAGDEGNDNLNGGAGSDYLFGGAGTDTASYADASRGVRASLATPATNTNDARGDTYDSVENLIGTGFADTLAGDGLSNSLAGRDGDDLLSGDGGNDRLFGENGNDVLDGGAGVDTLNGGAGNDTYVLGTESDMVIDSAGTDTITSTITRSLASYSTIENLTLLGTGGINGTGNALANFIVGNAGNNILDGGAGADTLVGGAGNDTYVLGAEHDTVSDSSGTDTITSTITRSLASYSTIENLRLLGEGNINGTGNGLNNVLTGNSGRNRLDGGNGNDTLDGGAGADTLVGGAGNDTYVLGAENDTVTDSGGTDTITSTITRSLASYSTIENLTLLGSGNINGTGDGLNNVLTGNSGRNRLDGGNGSDTLDGGAGADTLNGGAGNDTYVLGAENDTVTDSGGIDRITSTITRSLASYLTIENLTLLGSGNINGTGNALANTIIGNAGNNVLDGGSGNDGLSGGSGTDRLLGGLGNDTLTGGAGADIFVFNTAPNGSTNVDRITDFSVADDTIWLENSVLTALGAAGALSAAAFVRNTTGLAQDASDRLIYESDSGELYYDSNGSAAGGSTLIAVLNPNLLMTHLDFSVI